MWNLQKVREVDIVSRFKEGECTGPLRDAGGRGRNVSSETLNMVTMYVERVPGAQTAGRNQGLHSP